MPGIWSVCPQGKPNGTKKAHFAIRIKSAVLCFVTKNDEQVLSMQKYNKVLIILKKKIGDTVCAAPMLKLLRDTYPNARIDFLAKEPAATTLKYNKNINNLLIYKRKDILKIILHIIKTHYDLVIDLYPTEETALFTLLSGAKTRIRGYFLHKEKLYHKLVYNMRFDYHKITQKYTPHRYIAFLKDIIDIDFKNLPPMELPLPPNSNDIFAQAAPQLQNKDFIVFVPNASSNLKKWLPDYWADLAALIKHKYGLEVCIPYTGSEAQLPLQIKQSAALKNIDIQTVLTDDLQELICVLANAKAAVTTCTGTKHLAIALDIPTVTLQTITNQEVWHPAANPKHLLAKAPGLDCFGCDSDTCKNGNALCIKNLSPQIVMGMLEKVLKC